MLKKGMHNPNPKRAFLTDMTTFIRKWTRKGTNYEIILMADMNENICNNGDLVKKFITTDLIDAVGM